MPMSWKRVKARLNQSIFSRMVVTFLLIITPLYVLSIEVYKWAIETQKQDISNTMLSQVDFYVDNFEKEIQRIKLLQFYSTNDLNLQLLAYQPDSVDDYDKTVAVTQFQQYLKAVASSSSYIKSVSAYFPTMNRVVTSATFESSIPRDEFKVLDTNSYYSIDAQMIYWNSRIFLSVSNLSNTPLEANAGKRTPAYIIGVELDQKTLENALKQFNDYENGGAVMIDRDAKFELASTNRTETNLEMMSYIRKAVAVEKSGSFNIEIAGETYWAVYTSSDYLGLTLCKFIPEREVLKNFQKYSYWLWVFTATSVLLILLYSFSTYRLIYKPLSILVKAFRKMERGEMEASITHQTHDEFRYLYGAFNTMVYKVNTLIEQVYKQKILAQHAQLKQLQTQIIPHFLYNSYFILHRMVIDEDNDHAARFSQLLGNYLKFITRSGEDEVMLDREVEHARIYTEIVGMRFANRLSLRFEEPPQACKRIKVPRLVIQPIIENALEHGLTHTASGGVLNISFSESEGALDVIVEDNGTGLTDERLERLCESLNEKPGMDDVETTGIQNIHRRLRYRFGAGSGLLLSRSEFGGLKAVIRVAHGDV
ncbi:HAMP domain-containing protein [Paenibacillus antri]|uniref:HAMP domain-containing protein n=1 Tax=Paenibacillus antri TaxID=2582848 RepID=A0A5R9GEF2_9BACL|nr:histidine kinase [Paenibacillus antri]TLS52490.1 HAMP domain-containing protein [Paenibacillus antri]